MYLAQGSLVVKPTSVQLQWPDLLYFTTVLFRRSKCLIERTFITRKALRYKVKRSEGTRATLYGDNVSLVGTKDCIVVLYQQH